MKGYQPVPRYLTISLNKVEQQPTSPFQQGTPLTAALRIFRMAQRSTTTPCPKNQVLPPMWPVERPIFLGAPTSPHMLSPDLFPKNSVIRGIQVTCLPPNARSLELQVFWLPLWENVTVWENITTQEECSKMSDNVHHRLVILSVLYTLIVGFGPEEKFSAAKYLLAFWRCIPHSSEPRNVQTLCYHSENLLFIYTCFIIYPLTSISSVSRGH